MVVTLPIPDQFKWTALGDWLWNGADSTITFGPFTGPVTIRQVREGEYVSVG